MKNRAACAGWPYGSPCPGVPCKNPVWCDKCNKKRMAHLQRRFEGLAPAKNSEGAKESR